MPSPARPVQPKCAQFDGERARPGRSFPRPRGKHPTHRKVAGIGDPSCPKDLHTISNRERARPGRSFPRPRGKHPTHRKVAGIGDPSCPKDLHTRAYAATPHAGAVPNFRFRVQIRRVRVAGLAPTSDVVFQAGPGQRQKAERRRQKCLVVLEQKKWLIRFDSV